MAQSESALYLASLQPDQTVLAEWLRKMQEDTLTAGDLRSYWRDVVPRIYSPSPNCDCLNLAYDEENAKVYLFSMLEKFMCADEPEQVFEQLKALDEPPALCGRVFKNGEPTYSCRDCGMDPTCVLCVDCFKTSVHRNHRYKMSTSGGGGYCDCGDVEAWKREAYCQRHNQSNADRAAKNLDRLPVDLVARVKLALQTVLKYCYQLLTWERATDLPMDLQCKPILANDTYTTMLFNDEIHTYEQVIQTLHRAIECGQKEAIEFATAIDREGRSVVRCSQFKTCDAAKQCIERLTSRHGAKPLKVMVMHTSVVAHQTFAMRLLSWLQTIIGVSESLRHLFSETIMDASGNDVSVLEGVLLCDTQLWKTARSQWHQLMIGGMLMDQECKRAFAQVFTKNYPALMKEFITDDHDHSLSVTSLSVQIYTVPTLAHKLIAEENVLTVLLRTFLLECESRLTSEKKLAFERNQSNSHFKRLQYILFDLKYLLNSKPDQWSNQLRKHYLEGLKKLLILLSYMQGMDASLRQVGQHMEFEPEWESAFNLHHRLAPVITLVLDWCGDHRTVIIKAYRAALRSLEASQGMMKVIGRELANHSASCIDYDVSSQPVSIHLPLSRLVAGLHLHLQTHDLSFDSPEFVIKHKPTPEQLIELPLRTQVMIAQVHAGMWRRNGYSLLNQIYFYHTAKCRSEMLDQDVVMLQIGASLIESNEFLLHLLNKFGIVTWAREEYETDYLKVEEDSIRQIITLVEEFLGLLITIVCERFTPGVGQGTLEDHIQKEVVQQLCIEPMSHSQLSKALSEDPNHETGMEAIIDRVAVFKKPQGTGKGMYELKPEFLEYYNPFFYHYTREEQSKAEEMQRKRKKQGNEEECCPPPVPPRLAQSFTNLVNILQCDVMLHLMQMILERSANFRARSFSETQFQKILNLIGYALHEEQRYHDDDDPLFCFTEKAVKKGILTQLEGLVGNQRIEPHKDLLNWVLRKFRNLLRIRNKSSTEAMDTSIAPEEGTEDAKSTAALQEEKKRRAEIAAARRSRIMAQMSAMQKNFIREHADLFEKTKTESSTYGSSMDLTEIACEGTPICLGPKQSSRQLLQQRFTCILCQEDEDLNISGRPMVLAAFVQKSTVLSKSRGRLLENPEAFNPLLMPSDLFCAPHTSTCSHVMHSDCWQKYFDSVLVKERRRPSRFRQHLSFDVDRQEFLCPLCECLSNSVLPLIPPVSSVAFVPNKELSFNDWLEGLDFACHQTHPPVEINAEQPSVAADTVASKMCSLDEVGQHLKSAGDAFREVFVDPPLLSDEKFSTGLLEMLRIYTQATYTIGLGVHPHHENERVPLMMWWSCAYTIHTIEGLLRDQGKPLFGEMSTRHADCLNALIQVAAVCGSVSTPEILHKHASNLMRTCLVNDVNHSPRFSLLEVDAFALVIEMCFLLPHLFNTDQRSPPANLAAPSNGILEQHVTTFCFLIHILQILLTGDLPNSSSAMDTMDHGGDGDNDEEAALLQLLVFVREHAQLRSGASVPHSYQFLQFVQQSCVPFLRCCALFFYYRTLVPYPSSLKDPLEMEFEPLMTYLALPSFSSLWQNSAVKIVVKRWLGNNMSVSSPKSVSIRYPLTVNQLVRLPRDYSELINNVSLFTCPNSDGDDSRTPTMCLVCGEMLCSQSYCCQTELDGALVGACTYHAHYCGAGIGLFLRVRECKVLLLAGKTKGCFVSPPYLDDYGETDQDLRRGNPLHLCSERYKKLQRLWLSHGIPEEIAHALESNANILSTDWQHL